MPDRFDASTRATASDDMPDEALVAEILAGWRQRLRGSPDLQPREGLRGRRERALTRALLEAAESRSKDSGPEEEALRKLAMAAALYGADQPRERLDPGALCEELGYLRQAVWQHLRQAKLDRSAVTNRILAFDRALTIALRAALTGGFRCEPEEFPQWSERLDAIVSESVSPNARGDQSPAPPARDDRTNEPH